MNASNPSIIGRIASLVRKGIDSMAGGYQGIPAYWFARAIEVGGQETLFEPYRNSVWVQRAIKKVAGPVSSVQVQFLSAAREASGLKSRKTWTRRGPVQRAKQAFVELPDVAQWLEEPMPGLAYSDFVESYVGWLKLRGECFWLLDDAALVPFPETRTNIAPIIVARPDRMRHIVENGRLVGWVYTDAAGKAYSLLPEQVIQSKLWNPYDNWRGLSEFDAAQIAAEGDWLAGKFSRNLMANNGDTGPFIVAKNGVPSDPQREQIIADLKAKRQAQLRGDFRPIFMTGDISVEDPQVKTVDANFITQRLESRHEIAAAFGVPMSMFDVKNDFSLGSQSAYYQLILDTCIPTGAKLCDALERLISKLKGTRYEIGLMWDEHPVLQAVRRERMASMDALANRGMPMKDISDYLNLDLPRFEGDDIGFLPFNLTPIGSVEAEPEPTTNPALAETTDNGQQTTDQGGAVGAMIKALSKAQSPKSKVQSPKSKNHLLWEAHMRKRSASVKMIESKVNRVLTEFRAKALRQLASHGGTKSVERGAWSVEGKSLIDFVFDAANFGAQLRVILSPVISATLQTAADQVRKDELGLDDPWKFPPRQALEFINSRDQAVQKCGQTVRNQLNTALDEGYRNGESIEELSDRVRGVFNALSKSEAKRVAMTETGMAFNFSRHETMTAAGVEYKSWLSSHGPTVRPAHAEAEERYAKGGETGPIAMDETFEVGGEELMYPGDESGSPENIINCQCIQIAVMPSKKKEEDEN